MRSNELLQAVLFTTLIIFLLIAGIVVTLFISQRRTEKARRQLAQLELDYQKELRTIEAEVQEATLTHIASELHDNIGQLLTFMRLQLEKEMLRHPATAPVIEPVSKTLQTTMEQVRLLSHTLSQDFIGEGGLQRAIGQEASRMSGLDRFTVHYDTDGVEPVLMKDVRIVAFRIFQEALSNTIRHSGARNIYIVLHGGEGLRLTLQDDGSGFDKEEAMQAATGLGLKNMLRRAALAGLTCAIDTAPQKGCMFTITAMPAPVIAQSLL